MMAPAAERQPLKRYNNTPNDNEVNKWARVVHKVNLSGQGMGMRAEKIKRT